MSSERTQVPGLGDGVDGDLKEGRRYKRGSFVFEAQEFSFKQTENRQRSTMAVFSRRRGRRNEPQVEGVDLYSHRQGREDTGSHRG